MTINELAKKECLPCKGAVQALRGDDLAAILQLLDGGWRVINQHHLEKEYRLRNFRQALDFTVAIGEMAEKQGHHPDIYLAWGKVQIMIWTHAANGLTENDFIFAARADNIFETIFSNPSES